MIAELAELLAVDPSPSATLNLTDPVQPPVSRAEFGEVMSRLASTVSVVTASFGGETLGRTATAVLSLSATPPAVLVSVDIKAPLADLIIKSGKFSLAMLARDQEMVGDAFAGKLGKVDRFALGVWGTWPSGNPLLYGAATALDCELIGRFETQTHVLFAGAIIEADTSNPAPPLLWYQRQYQVPRVPGAPEPHDPA
ncbi:MAG TPA: flavin reductase family protein [Arsenicitalea sp.]|jgi:flavin reductase|nr:flavin reductase family protein [Arsenicitalea sp.]